MKTTITNSIVQIDADELKKYSPVNETVSTDFAISQPSVKGKLFSTADLWKLRKQRRMQGFVIR